GDEGVPRQVLHGELLAPVRRAVDHLGRPQAVRSGAPRLLRRRCRPHGAALRLLGPGRAVQALPRRGGAGARRMTLTADLLVRLGVGTALGGVIGYERDVHGRPAGFRTHLIVALASTLFTLVSTHFVYFQSYGRDDLVGVDPSRIAASVVTGIGFLGGGAILR